MNILQVGTGSIRIPPQGYGGVELYIYEISKRLAQAGHRVTILDIKTSEAERDVRFMDGIGRVCIHTKRFTTSSRHPVAGYVLSLIDLFLFALKVNARLRRENYDIIHLHRLVTSPVLVFLNRSLRKKMVYTAHSSSWAREAPGKLDRLALALDSYVMRRVGRVIAQAESLKASFIESGRVAPEKIVVIPSGVDTGLFHGDSRRGGELRRRYGLEGRTTVMFAGQIIPRKGIEYLVKAADILVNGAGYKDLLLLLVGPLAEPGWDRVGNADYAGRILGLIKDGGLEQNVNLTSAISGEDLRGLFSACDIFVLPSLAESSPAVTVQAMASARPVIGTRVAGIVAQIKDNWNGYLVEPANEKELAEKIKYLIDHPEERQRLGQNGRQFAEAEFDWKRIGERIVEVYLSLGK